MGILTRLPGIEQRMHERAVEGVDMVKFGLAMYLIPECEANFEGMYATRLTAAVVNVVFNETPSNDVGRLFLEDAENRKNVALVIEHAVKPQEKLRRIITDAVRVKCMHNYGTNRDLSETDFERLCHEPIKNLKRLGLLILGGEMPDLHPFLHNAHSFVTACKADLDLYRNRQVSSR